MELLLNDMFAFHFNAKRAHYQESSTLGSKCIEISSTRLCSEFTVSRACPCIFMYYVWPEYKVGRRERDNTRHPNILLYCEALPFEFLSSPGTKKKETKSSPLHIHIHFENRKYPKDNASWIPKDHKPGRPTCKQIASEIISKHLTTVLVFQIPLMLWRFPNIEQLFLVLSLVWRTVMQMN